MHGLCNMGKSGVENPKKQRGPWFPDRYSLGFPQGKTQAETSLFGFPPSFPHGVEKWVWGKEKCGKPDWQYGWRKRDYNCKGY